MRKELLLSHFIGVETKPWCCEVIFPRPQSQDMAAECLNEGRQVGGFPGGASDKEFFCNAGDTRDVGLIPGSGRYPAVGNGNPLQYSCLENSMDREEPGGLQSMGSQSVGHD